MTPLEVTSLPPLQDTGALVITAGGRNPDVIGALRVLAEREPRELAVVCAAEGSPLSDAAAQYEYIRRIEFSTPTGKDGFVATNTLLATAVWLARAYELLYSVRTPLPTTLPELFHGDNHFSELLLGP